jgi:DNA-binding LacI/PurR family transcriptional regulator
MIHRNSPIDREDRMAVTIADVAKAAGVSVSTVSRALNTPDLVNDKTRRRVAEVAGELGYAPNPAARSLREGRTETLGLVIPDVTNPFFPPIFKAMQERARRQHYTLLVTDSDEREADELETIAAVSKKVDGLIVWASVLSEDRLAELAQRIPLVLVNRQVPAVNEVHISLGEGIAQAAEHLKAYGHTRCVFINANGRRQDQARSKSIRESFDAHGMSVIEIGPYEPRFETGVHAAPLVVSHGATAVLAHNDLVAMGVLQQLAVMGVSVPRDVSVVGIDDTLLASVATPSLTTIRIDPDEVATHAVDLLIGLVEGRRPDDDVVQVGSRLIPRGTTGPAPHS